LRKARQRTEARLKKRHLVNDRRTCGPVVCANALYRRSENQIVGRDLGPKLMPRTGRGESDTGPSVEPRSALVGSGKKRSGGHRTAQENLRPYSLALTILTLSGYNLLSCSPVRPNYQPSSAERRQKRNRRFRVRRPKRESRALLLGRHSSSADLDKGTPPRLLPSVAHGRPNGTA
jgi:hypothetical protein